MTKITVSATGVRLPIPAGVGSLDLTAASCRMWVKLGGATVKASASDADPRSTPIPAAVQTSPAVGGVHLSVLATHTHFYVVTAPGTTGTIDVGRGAVAAPGGGGGTGGGTGGSTGTGGGLPPPPSVGQLDANVNQLRMTPLNAIKNHPVWIGRSFVKDEVPNNPTFKGLQTRRFVTNRHPGGSVKFAWMKTVIPAVAAGASMVLDVQDTTAPSAAPLTKAQMLAFDFEAQIKITEAGQTKTISARQMLQAGSYVPWDETTICLEDKSAARVYDLGGPLRSIHPAIYLTFWPETGQVQGRACGLNTNTESLVDMSVDVEILAGPSANPVSVFQQSAVPMKQATTWNVPFWIGGTPEQKVNLDHNIGYLAKTKYLTNFDPALHGFNPAADHAKWLASPRKLYEPARWYWQMPATGPRPDIGLHPGQMMQWAYTGDYHHREIALDLADRAGSWQIHLSEGDPARKYDRAQTIPALGLPVSRFARPIDEWPHSRAGTNTIITHSPFPPSGKGWDYQTSHAPDAFSIPYMLTGDPWYLRELQMWAAAEILVHTGELRGFAWGTRGLLRAHFLSLDGSPERAYLWEMLCGDAVGRVPNYLGERGISCAQSNTPAYQKGKASGLHYSPLHYAKDMPLGDSTINRTDPEHSAVHGMTDDGSCYQMTFWIDVLGEGAEKGYPGFAELLAWSAKWLTGPLDEGAVLGSDESKLPFMFVLPLRDGVEHFAARPPFPAGKVGGHGPYLTSWLAGGKSTVDTAVDPLAVAPASQSVLNAINPSVLAMRVNQFNGIQGDFAINGCAASTFIANLPGNGKALSDWLTKAVYNDPRAAKFALTQPQWRLLPRAPGDLPLAVVP